MQNRTFRALLVKLDKKITPQKLFYAIERRSGMHRIQRQQINSSMTPYLITRGNIHSTAFPTRAIVNLVAEMYQLPKEQLWKGHYSPENVAFHIRTQDDLITMLNCVEDEEWKKQLIRRISKTKLTTFLNEMKNENEKNQIKKLLDDHVFLETNIKQREAINEPQNGVVALGIFNPREPLHVQLLNKILDAQIKTMEIENQPLSMTFEKMEKWLEQYINNPIFYNKSYTDNRSKQLVAEATFWSVSLGLDKHFEKMSYAEIRQFQPLNERLLNKTDRSELIAKVCERLTKPAWTHEASYALGQAAWIVYARNHTFEKMEKDEKQYESSNSRHLKAS